MKRTIEPGDTPAAWDAEALYNKAERYMQQAQGLDGDGWDYALWTSLSLELLARAALANVHPALLADPDKTGSNLISALGFTPTEKRFAPKSIAISDVFSRLNVLVPEFLPEHVSFGIQHTGRRNAELHSGELGFDNVRGSSWQPRFYDTCAVLLDSMGSSLKTFVGKEEAKTARALIDAAKDEGAKAVAGDIDAHRKVWEAKSEPERQQLAGQAALWANRQDGHRVQCPACGSNALVWGDPVGASARTLEEDEIVERQEHLPSRFECVACGLKIAGLGRLTAANLADRYTNTQTYDAAQYYADQADEWARYEDDNNER